MTTRSQGSRAASTPDRGRVVRFAQGRHAFLLTNEGDRSGTVVLRPLTHQDVLESDLGRLLALVDAVLHERRPAGDRVSISCLRVSIHCDGDGAVACACLCERCADHTLACHGCDACRRARG